MIKLNFGCGLRFARGWVNIDFHSEHPEVRRVNLLQRWPFPEGHFDVVYSSHTLEHFSVPMGERLLRECGRVSKPGGILRIVVPDLENTCREYLRVLSQTPGSELARRQYDWMIIELLDQLTRTKPNGLMGDYRLKLEAGGDQEMRRYVRSRTDTNPVDSSPPPSVRDRLKKLTVNKLRNKLIYTYVAVVKRLLPPGLREAIVDNSRIGEKHRWMYDRYNLAQAMTRSGFSDVTFHTAQTSNIPQFQEDCLDVNPDGSVYKPTSLFCEARRR